MRLHLGEHDRCGDHVLSLPDYANLYESHGDKLRFLAVGAFNTAFGYVLYLIMLRVVGAALAWLSTRGSVPELITTNYFLLSQWIAWIISVPVGTMTMKYIVFKSRGHLIGEIARSYFVALPMVGVSSVLLWFAVRVLGLSPALGQILTISVAAILSYNGHKYFTFRVHAGNKPG